MKTIRKFICGIFFITLFSVSAFAVTPIKLSLWDRISAPPDSDVMGLELGFSARFASLHGVSINAVYASLDYFKGAQFALLNNSKGADGVQVGPLNFLQNETSNAHLLGAQVGIFNNADEVDGAQVGGFNKVIRVKGAQVGFINVADEVFKGAQVGFINVTEKMRGVQIGIINWIGDSNLPFMIIFNGKF